MPRKVGRAPGVRFRQRVSAGRKVKWMLIDLVRAYQWWIRPLHNRECIYTPSCSEYAIAALRKYGTFRGVYFAALRVRRCNGALYQGGEDWP